MTNLVTDAAIDAVMRWLPDFVVYTDGGLERARYTTRRNLETAAPHIAAAALRQAAHEFTDDNLSHWEMNHVRRYMTHRADELEGK